MKSDMISVVVPIYNAMPYLPQCVESILKQTYGNLEILLVNDGSTDESLQVIRDYATKDPRVRVIDKANEGYGATCNRGISKASGYWISIIEPDDWIDENMYAGMVAAGNALEGPIDIIKTPYWRVLDPDTPNQQIINCSYKGRIKPKRQPFAVKDATHLLIHHPSIWSAIYRRGFLEERNIRFMPIPGAGWADNPFLVETLCQTERIAYLDEPFYFYREETEEKTKATALNDTLLPLNRWSDMTDALERIGSIDPAIWSAHYQRGFTYLDGILAYVPLEREDVLEATIRMCDRMDPELVFSNPEIPPFHKRLFAQIRDMEAPGNIEIAHGVSLMKKAVYFLGNTGLPYTLKMVKRQLKQKHAE